MSISEHDPIFENVHESDDETQFLEVAGERLLRRQPVFWFYGLASVAFGIKDNAFSYLLLTYCNKVLSMPGYLAGRAMAIALVWDAVWDVLLGHLSDKTRSPLGRRHPYMYFSLLVLPVSFFFMFHPLVELNENTSFMYVLTSALIVRTGTTLCEIPSIAQLPDLEKDYERRNQWLALRYTFGWYGGAGLHVLNFTFWVGAYGQSSQSGYSIYGSVGSVVIFLGILISSLGTQEHGRKAPPPSEHFRLYDMATEIKQACNSMGNPNFQILFVMSILLGVAGGLNSALTIYVQSYYFALSGVEMAFVATAILVSPLLANLIAPRLGARLGKKKTAICSSASSLFLGPLPSVLVLVELWPTLGTPKALGVYTFYCIVTVTLSIISGVMIDSMMADVVEDGEVSTHRRSEGLYFAAKGFAGKAISGGGIIFAGNVVSFVGLDKVTSAAEMTWHMRYDMVMFKEPVTMLLMVVAIALLLRYRIGLEEHNANLAKLSARKLSGASAETEIQLAQLSDGNGVATL